MNDRSELLEYSISYDYIRSNYNWSPGADEKVVAVTFLNIGASSVMIDNAITITQSQQYPIPGNFGEVLSKQQRFTISFDPANVDQRVVVIKKIYNF